MDNLFIVDWHTIVDGFSSRGGYTLVHAPNKRGARKALRLQLQLWKGERLRITSVRTA